jgi:hypothetical protein
MTKEICYLWEDVKKIFNKENIDTGYETMEHIINILYKTLHNENK